MGIVDSASAAILHTERRSYANCQLEGTAFRERARTAGNQSIEAALKAVDTPSAARCETLPQISDGIHPPKNSLDCVRSKPFVSIK
jgi:hypothetical protein